MPTRPDPSVAAHDPAQAAAPVAARRPFPVASPNGTRIDDYYWLRDDTRESPEVLEYLHAENAYTAQVLAPLAPLEEQLFEELGARLAPEDASVPLRYRGYEYTTRYVAGGEYAIHSRRRLQEGAVEEILLDGNAMAQGQEYFDIGSWDVSPDSRLLAYTLDTVGRRQYVLHVKDLVSGEVLPDAVANVEPDIAWAADSRTLVYIEKDPVTLLSVRVRAHALGTAAAQDRLVYEEQDDSYFLGIGKSRSEQFLFITCASTEQSEWLWARADDPRLCFSPVLPREDGHEYDVEHHADDFIVRTNWEAPNFRLVRAPRATCADKATWRDVVAHREDVFLEDFEVSRTCLAINERHEGTTRIRLRDWGAAADGTADRLIEGDTAPCAITLVDTPGYEDATLRMIETSLVRPATTFDVDTASGTRTWRKTERVLGGFDATAYQTRRIFAAAGDGARIPVSLAWRRDTPLDGSAPLYQYGYGAYGYSLDPNFRSSWVSLMDRGFVVAIAHVRGGQELGRHWYDGGRLGNKRNSFTDFLAVTQALVEGAYGAADRVCASGGSAGGLLMGAVANLAPTRYRAIVAHVPFVDIVTTMLDDSIPLTTNEYDQWGDPRRPDDYRAMLAYSPYDNVRTQDYPALLVFTGLWDSQVQYFEPAKWVAKLRAHNTSRHPVLLSIDMSAGHGGKSGRYARYREVAREYAFLLWQLGLATGGR